MFGQSPSTGAVTGGARLPTSDECDCFRWPEGAPRPVLQVFESLDFPPTKFKRLSPVTLLSYLLSMLMILSFFTPWIFFLF